MGDPFKKVQSGDPLVIPAETFNTFLDAAKDFQRRQHRAAPASVAGHDRNGVITVKNASGSDQSRFAVLGLDAPVLTPTDNPQHFQNRVAMQAVTPAEGTHDGLFVVLREPLKAGAFGEAWALGVFPVQVDVQDEADGYAEIKDATTTELISGGAGSARILWKEAGTGVKWAVVLMPVGAAGGVLDNPVDETYSAEHPETISTTNEYTTDDAATVLWDREEPPASGAKGIKITLSAGNCYNDAGDEKLYDYLLDFEIDDAGGIKRITAKRRQTVDTPENCA